MLALVVVLSQSLFGAFYSITGRKLSVRLPNAQLQISAALFTMAYAVALPIGLQLGDVYWSDVVEWWPYFVLRGVLIAMSMAITLRIFRYVDAGLGTLLITLYIVAGVLGGMWLLGERMGLQQLIGSAIVLGAIFYVLSVHIGKRERHQWTIAIMLALAGAVCFGVSMVIEKLLLGDMSPGSYIVWGWGVEWIATLLLALTFGRKYIPQVFARRNLALLATAGVLRSGMGLLFVASLVMLKSLCIALVLSGLRSLFAALLGAWMLRERRFLRRKIIASICAAVGVALIFV